MLKLADDSQKVMSTQGHAKCDSTAIYEKSYEKPCLSHVCGFYKFVIFGHS